MTVAASNALPARWGRAFSLTIGPPIAPDAFDPDATVATEAVKAYVTQVPPNHPDQPFA